MAICQFTRALLLPILLTVLGITALFGDTISTWNGGMGKWGTASNWTPAVVPNNSGSNKYDVAIGSGLVNLDPGLNPTITSMMLGSDLIDINEQSTNVLTVSNNMAVNAPGSVLFEAAHALDVNGTLTNSGTISFLEASLSAGNFRNSGHLTMTVPGPPSTLSVPGRFENKQGAFVQLGVGIDVPAAPTTRIGQLVNNGRLFVGAGTVTLTNQPDGITDIPVSSSIELTEGQILAGSSSAFSKLTSVEGFLSFYVSPQTVTITPQNESKTLTTSGRSSRSPLANSPAVSIAWPGTRISRSTTTKQEGL
jgi:hypothetical protein